MERSDWLNFKKTGELDPNWLYQYYLENKDKEKEELAPISFQQYFHNFMGRGGQINKFIEYWDKKHSIITIIDNTENPIDKISDGMNNINQYTKIMYC
jgi:hypothetical protein